MKSDFSSYNPIFMGHNGRRTDVATLFDENIAYLTDARGLIKGTKELTIPETKWFGKFIARLDFLIVRRKT